MRHLLPIEKQKSLYAMLKEAVYRSWHDISKGKLAECSGRAFRSECLERRLQRWAVLMPCSRCKSITGEDALLRTPCRAFISGMRWSFGSFKSATTMCETGALACDGSPGSLPSFVGWYHHPAEKISPLHSQKCPQLTCASAWQAEARVTPNS